MIFLCKWCVMSLNGQLFKFYPQVWCKTTCSPDSAFVDTVFISLFSTVLIIKWTEDFTGMFMNFGSYFFWKIFPFMNEEQRHRDVKNNIIFSFWSIWREWKGYWFCLFVGWFVSPSLRIVIFSIIQLPKYLTHSSQWLHLQFLQFWKFLRMTLWFVYLFWIPEESAQVITENGYTCISWTTFFPIFLFFPHLGAYFSKNFLQFYPLCLFPSWTVSQAD